MLQLLPFKLNKIFTHIFFYYIFVYNKKMSTSNFNKMTIQQLKDFAMEHNVPLEGAKLKSDIIKKLKNYKPEEDCGCNVEFTSN